MNSRQTLLRDVLILFAFAGWAVALPGFASDFVLSLALTCLMYVALSTSWALFCGTTRYLSLATAAFFGVGAYTSALLVETWPWWQVVALGALVAELLAVFMGALVQHLRGTYFAILTFGMTELIRHTVTFYESTVTGTVGRMILVAPDSKTVYYTALLLAVAAVATSIVVRRTRFGLAMQGIGSDEQRAQTLGVDTRLVKIGGFALTAAFAGAVGAAMAVRWTYIDPTTVFNPFIGFQTVLIALIGGAMTLWGPLLAAILFSILAETLRLQAPELYMMSLGLLLILFVLYLPGGLASVRWFMLHAAWSALREGWRVRRYRWSGQQARDEARARQRARERRHV